MLLFFNLTRTLYFHLRSYSVEHTVTHQTYEVKQQQELVVVRWGTTCECSLAKVKIFAFFLRARGCEKGCQGAGDGPDSWAQKSEGSQERALQK